MKEKLIRYEAWEEWEDRSDLNTRSVTFATVLEIKKYKRSGIVGKNAKLIHVITAASPEEASAIFSLRMGNGPYRPMGGPKPCPNNCGSYFYPEGSGECPYCGPIW